MGGYLLIVKPILRLLEKEILSISRVVVIITVERDNKNISVKLNKTLLIYPLYRLAIIEVKPLN